MGELGTWELGLPGKGVRRGLRVRWRELFLFPSFVRVSFHSLLVITHPNWG
jgi:hypothetical protein